MNPNHQVTWKSTRPEFSIRLLTATSTSRGYHESHYEVVSSRPIDGDDFKKLDDCRLLGIGQAFYVLKSEQFIEDAPPVTLDRRTGEVLSDVPPVNWRGEPITSTYAYKWHRYVVKRICDSGD